MFKEEFYWFLVILPCEGFWFTGCGLIRSWILSLNNVCAVEERVSTFRFETQNDKHKYMYIVYCKLQLIFKKQKLTEWFEPDLKGLLNFWTNENITKINAHISFKQLWFIKSRMAGVGGLRMLSPKPIFSITRAPGLGLGDNFLSDSTSQSLRVVVTSGLC